MSLVYHGNGAGGSTRRPGDCTIGFESMSVTVADLNGDGIPDLAVANEGSNDVSILIGAIDSTTGAWTATPYQRLDSGGSGPRGGRWKTSAARRPQPAGDPAPAQRQGRPRTPGIGSGGVGSGFFQDANPQPIDLGKRDCPARPSTPRPPSNCSWYVPTAAFSILNGDQFTSLFFGQRRDGARRRGSARRGRVLDGSVGLLSGRREHCWVAKRPISKTMRARHRPAKRRRVTLRTRAGALSVIVALASINVVPELPPAAPCGRGDGPVGPELFVVATMLVPGSTGRSRAQPLRREAVPVEETFSLFAPSVPVQGTQGPRRPWSILSESWRVRLWRGGRDASASGWSGRGPLVGARRRRCRLPTRGPGGGLGRRHPGGGRGPAPGACGASAPDHCNDLRDISWKPWSRFAHAPTARPHAADTRNPSARQPPRCVRQGTTAAAAVGGSPAKNWYRVRRPEPFPAKANWSLPMRRRWTAHHRDLPTRRPT